MQSLEQAEIPESEIEVSKITGFDSGHRSLLREPTLYFSILGIFLISAVSLLNTPTIFWTVFISLSAILVIFHILAERYIFSTKKENKSFAMPYEGLFVVTFGSILPGISLLAYSLYSLFSTKQSNYPLEIGKIGLLLLVPILNFVVWSTIRRRYLKRPRLTGMMNGISLGLSASWTIIWLKTCFFSSTAASCKFGWMFLLFVSPLLLLAATLLQIDLFKKTETRIARITGAFSVLGALLSLLFVFTPTVHTMVVQTAIKDAKTSAPADLEKALAYLQSISSYEDLRPSEFPVGGFGLGGLLIPERGLESNSTDDQKMYFRITGKPYHETGSKPYDPKTWKPKEVTNINNLIGSRVEGLALAKSQVSGRMNPHTMSGSIDWTFKFHNNASSVYQPRAEITLPTGAVLSRATIWINNQPYEGKVVPTHVQNPTFTTPLLVSMSGTNKLIMQSLPIAAEGGTRKIRLSITMPLVANNGKYCMSLPVISESNFSQPKRTLVQIQSTNEFVADKMDSIQKTKTGFALNKILKQINPDEPPSWVAAIKGGAIPKAVAVLDRHSKNKQYIVQRLEETRTVVPKHLVVVVDTSAEMSQYEKELKSALAKIPANLAPEIYFAKSGDGNETPKSQSLSNALVNSDQWIFAGGQDNANTIREALETTAEKPNSAVVWIHGPQPIERSSLETSPLDLIHSVQLYDFEVQPGPNELIKPLGLSNSQNGCIYKLAARNSKSVDRDLTELISSLKNSSTNTYFTRSASAQKPDCEVIADPLVADQVCRLWAKNEVARLTEDGQSKKAESLATEYSILTPITQVALGLAGTKVYDPDFASGVPRQTISYVGNSRIVTTVSFENAIIAADSVASTQKEDTYRSMGQVGSGGAQVGSGGGGYGLVGAPVDPRFGQSNEVGQLADYGYDAARDLVRVLTALALLVAVPISFTFVRKRKGDQATVPNLAKAICFALAVPTTIHLAGTFMINNFGGLGGGL